MKINFTTDFEVSIEDAKLQTILKAFTKLLPLILTDFIEKILLGFAEFYMQNRVKPFECECGNNEEFTWKTKHGKKTGILTIFMKVMLNQLQVKCKKCGRRQFITRNLLGVEPRKLIPEETRRKLGLIGALASFRVSEKIVGMFGWALNKMTIWRAVQETGKEIDFNLDPDELPHGEADGTGIPIQGIKKRGKEMKVFVQLKKGGGIRIAGLSVDNYDKGWDKLFKPLLQTIKFFKCFLIVTDGDTSIFKGFGNNVNVLLQRCLWHIPHQLKYFLWSDKVKRKSAEWLYILAEIIDICSVKYLDETDEVIEKIIQKKEERLDELINYCKDQGFKKSGKYLINAKPYMFVSIKNRFKGKTTSRVERVMRTINLRINVGKWSTNGSLNAAKIRLAYYYNGYDVE